MSDDRDFAAQMLRRGLQLAERADATLSNAASGMGHTNEGRAALVALGAAQAQLAQTFTQLAQAAAIVGGAR